MSITLTNEPVAIGGAIAAVAVAVSQRDWDTVSTYVIAAIPLVASFVARRFTWGPRTVRDIKTVSGIIHDNIGVDGAGGVA